MSPWLEGAATNVTTTCIAMRILVDWALTRIYCPMLFAVIGLPIEVVNNRNRTSHTHRGQAFQENGQTFKVTSALAGSGFPPRVRMNNTLSFENVIASFCFKYGYMPGIIVK